MTKTHPVEMCHTRAKGRALRDFLNIGTEMLEELKQGESKKEKTEFPKVKETFQG